MTVAHARRHSIDELRAEERAQLDRVEPMALADELGDLRVQARRSRLL